jgi:predicted acylesterase/phospholipase RssA
MQELKNQRVGVSFLGGGMRAAAYVGVLQAFADKGINISSLIGASAGAFVASCHAFGVSNDNMLKHFRTFRPVGLVNPYKVVLRKRLNYDYWLKHASKLINTDWQIEAAPKKLAIRVVDMETTQSTYITSGPVAGAVIASSAILGSYNYQGKFYADGDFVPRTGAEVLRGFGAEVTFLIYADFVAKRDLLFPLKISQQATFEKDMIINPPTYALKLALSNPRLLSKRFLAQYYQEGYSQASTLLEKIIADGQAESQSSSQG